MEGMTPNEIILWIFIGIPISLLISYFIIRRFLSVERNLRYQETQIQLLAKIAKSSGVPEDEISSIINTMEQKVK